MCVCVFGSVVVLGHVLNKHTTYPPRFFPILKFFSRNFRFWVSISDANLNSEMVGRHVDPKLRASNCGKLGLI